MSPNYPITASGSIDMLGDEFPSMFYTPKAQKASPLAADFPDADTSNWSSDPRPTVTAWEGADMDAYWKDGLVWRHCQTGAVWEFDAARINAEALAGPHALLCADILSTAGVDAAMKVAAE